LLHRIGATVDDRGGGSVRWHRLGGDGSGLRRTEPRSRGGCRGVARYREGIARGWGGGVARRRPRCHGLVRASHGEEESQRCSREAMEWVQGDG